MTITAKQIKVFSITNSENHKIYYCSQQQNFYALTQENAFSFFGENFTINEPVTITPTDFNIGGLLAFPLVIEWEKVITDKQKPLFKTANGIVAIPIARYGNNNSYSGMANGYGIKWAAVAIDTIDNHYQVVDLSTYCDNTEWKNGHLDKWAEKLFAV